MKTLLKTISVLFLSYTAYALTLKVNVLMFNHLNDNLVIYILAPMVEDTIKFITGGWLFGLYESFDYYLRLNFNDSLHSVPMLINRLSFTMPMHAISYRIAKRYGLVYGILYHICFNCFIAYSGFYIMGFYLIIGMALTLTRGRLSVKIS